MASLSLLKTLTLVCAVLGYAGIALVAWSLVSQRRRGVRVGWRFWSDGNSFLPRERLANRGGFALALAAIAAQFLVLGRLLA